MDLDGVADRYDADFRDSKVQNIGDFDKKEKSETKEERGSVLEKLSYFKEKVANGDSMQTESIEKKIEQKEVI